MASTSPTPSGGRPELPAAVLYLLCGKIAAGKTTLARQLARRPSALLIAEDHWTSTLYPDELRTIDDYARYSARLEKAIAPLIIDILRKGLSVVMDFHANTVRRRCWLRGLADVADVAHELHWLDVSDEVCKQRLKERNESGTHPFQVSEAEYEQFARHFVPPASDEGFTVIVHKF